MPNKNLAPLNWDDDAVDLLAMIAPGDEERARIWWATFAPVAYQAILDAGLLENMDEMPSTPAEFEKWLSSQREEEKQRKRRYRALGILLFFLAGRYLSQRGSPIGEKTIRSVLDSVLNQARSETDALCALLREGRVSLSDWQMRMSDIIKNVHVASSVLRMGGYGRMSPDDWAKVEQIIGEQLNYLNNFANQIATGQQKLDGTLCRRMRLYLQAGRGTYHDIEIGLMEERGYDQYRNVLGAAEHCNECVGETGKGWVSLGDLVPIGSRICQVNCQCSYEYRISSESNP